MEKVCISLILDELCDLDLWPHPWPEIFKVKFSNSCISGIVDLIDVKRNEMKSIRYWVDFMTLPFDHTHDLDLEVLRSKIEKASFQEWDGLLT